MTRERTRQTGSFRSLDANRCMLHTRADGLQSGDLREVATRCLVDFCVAATYIEKVCMCTFHVWLL
jgi:hypothetical protein